MKQSELNLMTIIKIVAIEYTNIKIQAEEIMRSWTQYGTRNKDNKK